MDQHSPLDEYSMKFITYSVSSNLVDVFCMLLARFMRSDGIMIEENEIDPDLMDISCWLTQEECNIVHNSFPNMRDLSAEVEELLSDI